MPLAFASPGNRYVVYHTWDKPTETPILRVVLHFADRRLTIERILRLDGSAGLDGRYGVFFSNPRLLDGNGRRVVVRADVVNRTRTSCPTS